MAHLAVIEIDYRNKLEKFLDNNNVKRNDPASQKTLDLLKVIFKEYWEGSAKWAEFADNKTIAQWEGSEYKGLLSLSKGKIMTVDANGKTHWEKGITNPINGKVLLSTALSNYGLASTFIHEMVHSMDFVSGLQTLWNNFSNGHDYIEARAYIEEASWTGGNMSSIGTNHLIQAMPIFFSNFNLFR